MRHTKAMFDEEIAFEVDVRLLPTWRRHARIVASFDALAIGEAMRIVSDHEPRPLKGDFERLRPGQFVWLQSMLGNDIWEVLLRRITESPIETLAHLLARSALFSVAKATTIEALERSATRREIARNESLCEQGTPWPHLGLVLRGGLRAIVTSPLGREHALYDVLSGESFGILDTIDGGVASARLIGITESTHVAIFPRSVVRTILHDDLRVARAVNAQLAQRLRMVIDRFTAQTSLPTIGRVATALLPHASPAAGLSKALPSLDGMTQGDLAVAAGTVKEVVNRSLAELEAGGAIERVAGRIVRLNRESLTQIVANAFPGEAAG
ncbi:MAG: DUF2249 domain-containing protein [Candidatus Eremiobacteraeota bacterium]|nr:DUF2249 domain-containing protein [Candidatus Eremiobacteraeota bacterium]NNM93139.1 DUF2249 domain-containing protein [Candidatus Eremiobacteraeota bacterium]